MTPLPIDTRTLYCTSTSRCVCLLCLCLVEFLSTASFLWNPKPKNPGKLSLNAPHMYIPWVSLPDQSQYKTSLIKSSIWSLSLAKFPDYWNNSVLVFLSSLCMFQMRILDQYQTHPTYVQAFLHHLEEILQYLFSSGNVSIKHNYSFKIIMQGQIFEKFIVWVSIPLHFCLFHIKYRRKLYRKGVIIGPINIISLHY